MSAKITKLFDGLDPSTVLVPANAIYFHAAWATPFDRAQTEPGTFTTGTGKRVTAKFMSGGRGLQTAQAAGYDAGQLPYRGGRFAALVIMPRTGSLSSFVAGLTPSRLSTIASSVHAGGAAVSMPRFKTTSTLDLVPTLGALGMRDAFGPGADLSALSPTPTYVDQVVQRVYLGVGEKGTTAAAATGIAFVSSGTVVAQEIDLDHPFLFLVRDMKSGAVLFAADVQDPTAS